MNEIHIYVDDHGLHQAYRLVTPTHRLDIGPAFKTPREAVDYANAIEGMPVVSPLRLRAETPTARSSAPAEAEARLGVSAGERRQGSSTRPLATG